VDQAVELSAVIEHLRAELSAAMQAGRDQELRFELGTIQVELAVVLERSAEPGGKVRFWVVEAGVDGRYATSRTQRLQLTLEPRSATDPGRRPWVAGRSEDGER
jgi:Trypsin-co-occurring domain 2